MMNTYLRVMEFEIDGKVARTESWVVLIDDKDAMLEVVVDGHGKTFDSLWDYHRKQSSIWTFGSYYSHV